MATVDPKETDMPLEELSVTAAKFGSWVLKVTRCNMQSYEYEWNNQKKTGKKLLVTLVSTDPSAYCLGVARMVKGNESELQSVSMQFKEGMIYRFSGVSFVDSEKKQYIAAPVKHVLDLRKTKRESSAYRRPSFKAAAREHCG